MELDEKDFKSVKRERKKRKRKRMKVSGSGLKITQQQIIERARELTKKGASGGRDSR